MRALSMLLPLALSACLATPPGGLDAAVSDKELVMRNPNGGGGTLTMQLRANGTGTLILDEPTRKGSEDITWRTQGGEFCLTPQPDGLMSSSGQEECVAASVGPTTATFGLPGSGFVMSGTVRPL